MTDTAPGSARSDGVVSSRCDFARSGLLLCAIARFVAAVRWKVRTVKKRVVETVTYGKRSRQGGIGVFTARDRIGKIQAAAVGCLETRRTMVGLSEGRSM
ncbi:hypothetical protein GCM10017774_30920 [Lentzea cavernae]|uniref:Uncharacterized protein n=1 Tax=Lentzea cavernae TaxID=2020703 RepID=A0ABQ3MCB4_9PSEU|nr:hypothetical protein GCM10017774_30920 [Lentzea cavernae]